MPLAARPHSVPSALLWLSFKALTLGPGPRRRQQKRGTVSLPVPAEVARRKGAGPRGRPGPGQTSFLLALSSTGESSAVPALDCEGTDADGRQALPGPLCSSCWLGCPEDISAWLAWHTAVPEGWGLKGSWW